MTQPVNGHALNAEVVPLADLVTYERNPRQGNVSAIASSLEVLGQYRPIVVNSGSKTGRPSEVVAGNHTLEAARKLGWSHLTAVHVDVDDETCARIVAADNRTADLGSYDDRLLLELLSDLPDLDGTGYEPGDLDDLATLLDDEVWDGSDGADTLDQDEGDDSMHPKIALKVTPRIFEAWRDMLDGYDGKDDTAKLTAHLRDTGHLT